MRLSTLALALALCCAPAPALGVAQEMPAVQDVVSSPAQTDEGERESVTGTHVSAASTDDELALVRIAQSDEIPRYNETALANEADVATREAATRTSMEAMSDYDYDDEDEGGDEEEKEDTTSTSSSTSKRHRHRIVWKRLDGVDRYHTMSSVVTEAFPSTCDTAVVASGNDFPDALTASSLAGALECPVILTKTYDLTVHTTFQLERLGVKTAYILGGENSVSADTEAAINNMGIHTIRIAGDDRYLTGVEALYHTMSADTPSDTVIVATGLSYPDTLSIGPWAYATGSPIVLTTRNGTLTDTEVQAIKQHHGIKHVVIVGGVSSVDPEVEEQLGDDYSYTRLGGADRYDTSQRIADWETDNGFDWSMPSVTTGLNFPDALAASSLNGGNRSPILLSDSDTSQTIKQLYGNRMDVARGYVLGGISAVPNDDPLAVYEELVKEFLSGVDISGWDKGIDIYDLDADFVIIKATEGLEGTEYNPWYDEWADQVLDCGMLLGFYHYANGEDPIKEADDFYEAIKDYKGQAIACLDWEGQGNELFDSGEDVEWCKLFLDRIQELFGGTPFLYTSKDYAIKYDWSPVAESYPLWGAEYPDYEEVEGYDNDPWQSSRKWGVWGALPTIFQYTSSGTLEHNGGIDAFDFNLFYGKRADWLAYQG